MIYVTITSAKKRGKRLEYDTDDPAEAVSKAVADFLPGRRAGATVLGVLIEKAGTELDNIDLAEELEIVRSAEVERAA